MILEVVFAPLAPPHPRIEETAHEPRRAGPRRAMSTRSEALGVAIMMNGGPGSVHAARPFARSSCSPPSREPSRAGQHRDRRTTRAQRAVPGLGRAGRGPLPPQRRARPPRHRRRPGGCTAPARRPPRQRRRPTTSFGGSGHLTLRRPRPLLGLPAPRSGSRRHGRHRPASRAPARRKRSCGVARSPTPPERSNSGPSTPAGARGGRCTFTRSCTPHRRPSPARCISRPDQRRVARHRSLQRAAGPRHHQRHRHDLRDRRHPHRARHHPFRQ